ncbi:hypothetical protein [Clostridium beijerinckii]|jgi:hypothetical protein|uniref:hypothetical protein n=1 Tax=Clostridium beijerinckii TaxID=1520 RepID=UPI00156F0A67|nr:hypothetical protein [Clostridium beijerinckii]NRU52395.1 hypothetical protein [Clostridium beijerinckii]NRU52695.1 hypothetical protein [Clostridium beijerinckii]NYC68737.1 hypothetical protein [Clostridium beijerinckii]NYC91886.1 hypothetical protein [Clostridium beijerinckii]
MKKVKAISLDNLAWSDHEMPIYEYSEERGLFVNNKYEPEAITIESIVVDRNWLVFETEIIVDENASILNRNKAKITPISPEMYEAYFGENLDVDVVRFMNGEESIYNED